MMYHNDYIRYRQSLALLGLEGEVTFDEAKRRYRELVRIWHPDRFAGRPTEQTEAEERMKGINEVFTWLALNRYLFDVEWEEEYQAEEAFGGTTPERTAAAPRAQPRPKKTSWWTGLLIWLAFNGLLSVFREPKAIGAFLLVLIVVILIIVLITRTKKTGSSR